MKESAKKVYLGVKRDFVQLFVELSRLRAEMDQETNFQELIDSAYAARETIKVLDQMKKELNSLTTLVAAKTAIVTNMTRGNLRTPYCTAKVKVTKVPKIPSKRRNDPEAFDKIMADLGIPIEIYSQEFVRVHWPKYKEYCAEVLADGGNLPVPLDDCTTDIELEIRKRKEIS